MAERVQRVNYHTGLFLEQEEFRLEQNYHLLMRRRFNFALFRPGVLYGMDLNYDGTDLVVNSGMAIDEFTDSNGERLGREILLLANSPPVNLAAFNTNDTVWVTIRYGESATDPKAPTDTNSRITETPVITPHSTDPGPGSLEILLGNIVVGTPSQTAAVQQVVLKLGGVATPLPPSIANFTPSNGSAGTSVTITGNNFIGATEVRFGGTAAGSFTVDSDTQITATVPAGATTGPITVITPVGSGASATNFTVTVPIPAPTVDSFTPATGGVGTTVTITGGNFTGVSGVSFGGVATSSFTVVSGTEITATVPTGAVTGRIRVTNATGFGESATDFQVVAAPTFDAANPFTPRQGFQNNPVAINGQNFDVDSPTPPQVFFGTIQAPVSNFTPTLIQVSVPPGGTPQLLVPVRVVTTGGEARSDTLTPPVLFRFL